MDGDAKTVCTEMQNQKKYINLKSQKTLSVSKIHFFVFSTMRASDAQSNDVVLQVFFCFTFTLCWCYFYRYLRCVVLVTAVNSLINVNVVLVRFLKSTSRTTTL